MSLESKPEACLNCFSPHGLGKDMIDKARPGLSTSLRATRLVGPPQATPLRSWKRWDWLAEKLPLLYLAAAALTAFYVCQDEHVAVSSEWYSTYMPPFTYGSWSFGTEELIKPFRNLDGVSRPRFLTHFFLTADYYLRFFLYQYWRIPTNFSIMYISELCSVVLFYKTVLNLTNRRIPAQVGTALYVTSLGFTSGLSFMFTPAKAMTNVIFVIIVYLSSEMWKRDQTKLFMEHGTGHQLAVMLTAFIGFNFDEGAFFAPAIIPILFPSMFLPRPETGRFTRRQWLNLGIYLLPVLAFLLFVLIIVPIVTRATYGYSFDFIATMLGRHDARMGLENYGLAGYFTLATLYANFLALFEPSFVPWQLRPYLAWGANSILGALYIGTVVLCAVSIARLGAALCRRLAYRSFLLLGLFILFTAVLNGRQGVVANGYYYGSAIAVFMSLSLALIVCAVRARGAAAQGAAILLVALPIAIQIDHSVYATSQSQIGYDANAADFFAKPSDNPLTSFKLERGRRVSRQELDWIWTMWKAGKLLEVTKTAIAPGSLYLVAELYRFDQLKIGSVPEGLNGAETIRR
jgi:hypothetical protein